MELIRKNTRLLFILVLPVYFYIIQSSILNKHTHFYPNGLIITHSHTLDFDDEEPVKNHGHSQTEICLFPILNIDLHTTTTENVIDFKFVNESVAFVIAGVHADYTSPNCQIVPRGPPFRIL